MAADENNDQYAITWDSKPLGFSIVMDTTGRNAYVSSIQKQDNLKKGLKLAAQIIKINGENVKQHKHGVILDKIKRADIPMTLTFQPRSFANANSGDNSASEETSNDKPIALLFGGAPDSARNRVDGMFLLCKNEETNGKPMWQRKDDEDDPIVLWYWPQEGGDKGPSGMGENLWMISRASQLNTQKAYACCPSSVTNPLNITQKWKVWKQTAQEFVECSLQIADKVDQTSITTH